MHTLWHCRLWVHEVFRVYYDRLVDDQDRSWIYTLLKDVVKFHFKEDFNGVFKHLSSSGKVRQANVNILTILCVLLQLTEDDMRSLLFGDYMKPDAVSVMMSWYRDHMVNDCIIVVLIVGAKTV